jgi:putative chitinase
MSLTIEQLRAIMPNCPASRAERFLDPLNAAMEAYEINTPARQAAFLAQVAEESGELRYTEELASGEDYEGRLDLGNNQPGDGRKFKGHGFIQITGRRNTRAYADYKAMPMSDVLGYLETDEGACDSAGWFWIIGAGMNLSKRAIAAGVLVGCNLNDLADAGDFELITWAINGGLSAFQERTAYFYRAAEAHI